VAGTDGFGPDGFGPDGSGPDGSGPGAPDESGPGAIVPGDAVASEKTVSAVARLAEPDLSNVEKRRALAEIAAALRKRGFRDMFRPTAAFAWLAEAVVDIAPRI